MSKNEFDTWRTQIASSKSDQKGLRYAPFCFTEQGVTMLSCILNNTHAIEVNIRIIRVFTKMREMLLNNKEILLKLEQMEKDVLQNSDDVKMIFEALKQLINNPTSPRKMIGFKQKKK